MEYQHLLLQIQYLLPEYYLSKWRQCICIVIPRAYFSHLCTENKCVVSDNCLDFSVNHISRANKGKQGVIRIYIYILVFDLLTVLILHCLVTSYFYKNIASCKIIVRWPSNIL